MWRVGELGCDVWENRGVACGRTGSVTCGRTGSVTCGRIGSVACGRIGSVTCGRIGSVTCVGGNGWSAKECVFSF